ncbi:1305_t:CDS:2, partial [Acaulospora colombiana]
MVIEKHIDHPYSFGVARKRVCQVKEKEQGGEPLLMDAPSNFWEALPIDGSIFALANITPAKPDDTTTLLSLPVELLELIVEYCNTRSLFPLLQTNRTLCNVVLRRLYATIHLHIDYCSKGPSPKPSEVTKLCRLNQHQVKVLRALTQQRQHLSFLRQLHIVKLQWSQTDTVDRLHQLFHYALDGAVSLQHLTFANCDPIPDTAYNGQSLSVPTYTRFASRPNVLPSANSRSLERNGGQVCVTSAASFMSQWETLTYHLKKLTNLHPNSFTSTPFVTGTVDVAQIANQLPQLTSVTLEDHRSRVGYNKDEEREAIESFYPTTKNPPTRYQMDTWSDLWDALPADDNLYSLTNIPPAKPDATVNIFSLPIELLRTIIELCNNRSILALMRVNRALHLVALWKFYANVYIPASRHDTVLSLIDNELPITEVIPNLFKKQFGVLGG